MIKNSESAIASVAGSLFSMGEFRYFNGRINVSDLLDSVGKSHQALSAVLKSKALNSKAMKWISKTPKAFRVDDGAAVLRMVEGGFLVLIEQYGQFEVIDILRNEISEQMRIPIDGVDVKLSVSTTGGGAGWHFDRWDTVQIHLYGEKKWKIGINKNVSSVLSGHVYGTPPEKELCTYLKADELDRLPAYESFDLNPGDCFFVPNGVWHSTETTTSSCTLIARVRVPSFIDLVIKSERREDLLRNPEWRKKTYGLWNFSDLSDEGRSILTSMAQLSGVCQDDLRFQWEGGRRS